MTNVRNITLGVAAIATLAGLFLALDRSGLIAWLTLLSGAGLLAKFWFKPGQRDLLYAAALVVIPVLAWFGTRHYVITTWETGEVVELAISTNQGPHVVRLWVMDIEPQPVVYYDAPPHAAEALLAGKPLQFTRAGNTSQRIPRATRVEEIPEARTNLILEAMNTKYGDRNDAATVYYLMLGRASDQVALVINLTEA